MNGGCDEPEARGHPAPVDEEQVGEHEAREVDAEQDLVAQLHQEGRGDEDPACDPAEQHEREKQLDRERGDAHRLAEAGQVRQLNPPVGRGVVEVVHPDHQDGEVVRPCPGEPRPAKLGDGGVEEHHRQDEPYGADRPAVLAAL